MTVGRPSVDGDARVRPGVRRERPSLLLLVPITLTLLLEGTLHLVAAVTDARDIASGLTGPGPSFILAVLNYLAAVALASGRRVGWVVAMSLSGWNVAYFLFLWAIDRPAYFGMALAVVIILLLNSDEMRRAYRAEA